jgi:hypothetical protein
MKQHDHPDGDEERPPLISIGAICEFHDPKHGNGQQAPVLGVVQTCDQKAKGGMRLTLQDENGHVHSVRDNAIHIVLPPYKGKEVDPATQLKEYVNVQRSDVTELGVEPEMLELAWEIVASEVSSQSFTPKRILSEIDEKLFNGPVDQYKAFRLLTSDLGKVFFKSMGGRYKPKSPKSVTASKENWCRQVMDGAMEADWCFAV